jgi:hypothetical protein
MTRLHQPTFNKRILDHNLDNNIISLECGHRHKIFDTKLLGDDKTFFCSTCVSEYLVKRNREINEHFKDPIVKGFPEK